MADKKSQVVIKKVKKGGHGGAHGGAWKVAYADFVTAMMCFFLVMWLMGADEATKASIAAYFNNPSSPSAWRPDQSDPDVVPLGNRTGVGDSVLRGANGQVEESLVEKPAQVIERKPQSKGPLDSLGELSGKDLTHISTLTFGFERRELFGSASSTEITEQAYEEILPKIARTIKNMKGTSLVIRGVHASKDDYELRMSQLVAIQRGIGKTKSIPTDQINVTLVRNPASSKVEFTIQKD